MLQYEEIRTKFPEEIGDWTFHVSNRHSKHSRQGRGCHGVRRECHSLLPGELWWGKELPRSSGLPTMDVQTDPSTTLLSCGKEHHARGHVIEQLGTYDPMVNVHGEKLVALNTERINHWIGQGAGISTSCAVLLGLSGLLPIHPRSYMTAWRSRRSSAKEEKAEAAS
ncbi:hypothetical protein O3P69_011921 [Scylla paramamosain]|uniref:Small ribosomal subunit protein bS16m n=1 Tax=Scylla paramamosain TaxID=85552 RepID=A0AAW0SIA0_SCYPA